MKLSQLIDSLEANKIKDESQKVIFINKGQSFDVAQITSVTTHDETAVIVVLKENR